MIDRSIVNNIYNSIFKTIKRTEVDLFLCGGASTAKRMSYRDKLRDSFKNTENLAVYYPEDLFSEILSRKKTDLLTLERILAENSDVIIIFCESAGSFTELGAFVSSGVTSGKVVPFIQSKYKNDKSFINQGPVEYLKAHSTRKTKVVYFSQDSNSTKEEAKRVLRESASKLREEGSKYSLIQISGQVCLILLLLYFFDSVEFGELRDTVKYIYEIERDFEADCAMNEEIVNPVTEWQQGFDTIYVAAIKQLYKKGYLNKREDLGQYHLTSDGYLKTRSILKNVGVKSSENSTDIPNQDNKHHTRDKYSYVDKIRLDVLRKSYYRYG